MPFELAVTIQEPAKQWIETWGNPIISAGAALLGAGVGSLATLQAVRRQVELTHGEADKAALFNINAKLLSIADESKRLASQLSGNESFLKVIGRIVPNVELKEPLEIHRFTFDELYRAYRLGKEGLVNDLRMVERVQLGMASDYDRALEIRRAMGAMTVNVREESVLAEEKKHRERHVLLNDLISAAKNGAILACQTAETVQFAVSGLWLERYQAEIPGKPDWPPLGDR